MPLCSISMDPKTIRTRLQELAFLNSQASIWYKASPAGQASSANGNGKVPAESAEGCWEKLHYSGGLREYVQHLNRDNSPMHEPIFIREEVSSADMALPCVQHPHLRCSLAMRPRSASTASLHATLHAFIRHWTQILPKAISDRRSAGHANAGGWGGCGGCSAMVLGYLLRPLSGLCQQCKNNRRGHSYRGLQGMLPGWLSPFLVHVTALDASRDLSRQLAVALQSL